MEIKDKIIIAEDFSKKPGARYIREGDDSGELFLNEHLLPKFILANKGNYKILIDLDGVLGFPSSFVSGSFGKLSLKFGPDSVLKHLQFKSDRNSLRIAKIKDEILNPTKKDEKD